MGKGFRPDRYIKSLYHIKPDQLLALGIQCVLLDIDNTLVPSHTPDADDRVILFINQLKMSGIQAIILSNARSNRVERFNRPLGLQFVGEAWKPSKKGYEKAFSYCNCTKEHIAMIGDQVFTDIIGGNNSGIYTILVQPINPKEPFWVKLKRIAEKWVIGNIQPEDQL